MAHISRALRNTQMLVHKHFSLDLLTQELKRLRHRQCESIEDNFCFQIHYLPKNADKKKRRG